jgi:hypothetical protein
MPPKVSLRRTACIVASVLLAAMTAQAQIARTRPFVVTDSSVRQGRFEAVALSRDTIVSSYPRAAREVRFRFSINGAENEFPPGTEHTIYLRPHDGKVVTRVYRFGDETEPPPLTPEESATSEDGVARVTFRVDLRHVLRALQTQGFFAPALGARIERGELAHVYVLGDPEPLTWEYAALRPGSPLELRDADGNGVYEGTVPIETAYTRPRAMDGRALWARWLDVSGFPELSSSQRLQDALYRLSLEELRQLVREDGALSAGAKWPGVWTRDVSLSTILSLAIVAPDAAKRSLLAKVDSAGRIIQDTGTGGSWPVSTDRMVWSLAAWEIYAMTGDREWLRLAYDITRRSAEADLHAVRDSQTGLFNGESSFMDWREQSYPRWMQPADIYRSQNLGTNAVHYAAYRVLAKMSRALGEPEPRWDRIADSVRSGMSANLWQRDRGWYGQYRYGRANLSLSPRADGLGESLAAIFGVASPEQRVALLRSAPVVAYGTPTFWPYTPGERFYHNATIWPFVTAYWSWAAAEGGNTLAVQRGLDDATRAVALFLTNKENMVAATGHYEGTALNSDRQLWSVAGTLAGTFRLLFGMRLEPDRLSLRPMVPPSYRGERVLRGVRYRQSTLTITVRGFGDSVRAVRLDGARVDRAEIMAAVTGAHAIELTMNGRWRAASVHEVASRFAPATPRAELRGDSLVWSAVPGAVRYVVYENGTSRGSTSIPRMKVAPSASLSELQVLAVNAVGDESFLSEPVRVVAKGGEVLVKPNGSRLEREHAGFTGEGYLPLTLQRNITVHLPVHIERAGSYAIDARYANGNGPVNTEDKVAVRTLMVDGDTAGVIVLPQRGVGRWTEWGWTNVLRAQLRAGAHTLTLTYMPLDANMNGHENTALLDLVRLTRLASMNRASR